MSAAWLTLCFLAILAASTYAAHRQMPHSEQSFGAVFAITAGLLTSLLIFLIWGLKP